MILGIESSSDKISVALVNQRQIIQEIEHPQIRKHSEQIGGLISELLSEIDIPLRAVAISGGPGSYTGLRIGSSLAKGLCFAYEIPLLSVSSLLSCAWPTIDSAVDSSLKVLSVFPSRLQEVYVASFLSKNPIPVVESEALNIDEIDEWLELQDLNEFQLLGPGSPLLLESIKASGRRYNHISNVTSKASNVAILGEIRLENNLRENIESYEPEYLKPFVAKQGTPIFERLEKNRKRETK